MYTQNFPTFATPQTKPSLFGILAKCLLGSMMLAKTPPVAPPSRNKTCPYLPYEGTAQGEFFPAVVPITGGDIYPILPPALILVYPLDPAIPDTATVAQEFVGLPPAPTVSSPLQMAPVALSPILLPPALIQVDPQSIVTSTQDPSRATDGGFNYPLEPQVVQQDPSMPPPPATQAPLRTIECR